MVKLSSAAGGVVGEGCRVVRPDGALGSTGGPYKIAVDHQHDTTSAVVPSEPTVIDSIT